MFTINIQDVERLQKAMIDYAGNTEEAINDVLHNQAGELIQEQIYLLMPRSPASKKWKGKAPHAKDSKSLRQKEGNLSVTVTTAKKYQYLYFPDDGSNTIKHAGEQHFFRRGGEAATGEVVERCITRLITDFEKGT